MSWRDIIRKEEKAHCGTEKYDDDTPFKDNRYGGRGMPKKHKRGQEQGDELSKTNSKPDFLDLDGDGNKTEPMKEAAKDKKGRKRGTVVPKPKSKNPFTRKD